MLVYQRAFVMQQGGKISDLAHVLQQQEALLGIMRMNGRHVGRRRQQRLYCGKRAGILVLGWRIHHDARAAIGQRDTEILAEVGISGSKVQLYFLTGKLRGQPRFEGFESLHSRVHRQIGYNDAIVTALSGPQHLMKACFRLTPLAAALLPLFLLPVAQAETPPAEPVTVEADQLQGQMDETLRAEGNVTLRQGEDTLQADWLDYFIKRQQIRAGEQVHLQQPGREIRARQIDYQLDSKVGHAANPDFRFSNQEKQLQGSAERLAFLGPKQYRLEDAKANTCSPGDDAWYLKAGTIDLDYTRNIGVARNARLEFQGVPILYSPWMDFPLDGGRKSGLLFPTIKTGSDGFEATVPYYWNIAPNLDATISPRYIQQRGVLLGLEGRYLQPDFNGEVYTEQLPDDRKNGHSRFLWKARHWQDLGQGLSGGVNASYVSDDNYLKDLGDRASALDGTNLLREGWLAYQQDWGSLTLRAQRYQTLQTQTQKIDEPYARVPQLDLRMGKTFGQIDTQLESELTRFGHSSKRTGNRLVVYPTVSYGFERSWGFVRPKLGWHYTRYDLDNSAGQAGQQLQRSLPVFSLDSGLYFDRQSTLFGQAMQQTLEPRLYYVRIPAKDQSQLPNFDTSENDFNYAQLFTENRFSGWDRINSADQLTAALTSRHIDAQGMERLRLAIGQRFYLDKDNTMLDGKSSLREEASSDILMTIGGDLNHALRFDSAYQYNVTSSRSERFNAQLRYTPEAGKTASIRYRYGRDEKLGIGEERGTLRQIDIAGQWPLAPRWYGVARYNYSLRDKKALEQLAGVEYNDGCWSLRLVGQRYVTDVNQRKNAVFIQLELKDFSSVGNNPLNTLRLSIPGYSQTN